MKVIVHATPMALWQNVVHQAQTNCATTLQQDIEIYLIFLLMRYVNQPEMVKQVMAPQFLQGLKCEPREREVVLQGVGDTCLIFSGLFPGLAEKRLVKISYFVNLGRSAYMTISKAGDDIYSLLSQQFVSIMDILQSIRQCSQATPNLLPLQAYELWHELGSQRALAVLKQYTLAIPVISPSQKEPIPFLKLPPLKKKD